MREQEHQDAQPFEILFVCFGNICRSPMAEGIARKLIETEYPTLIPSVGVSSAGVAAMDGGPATPEAVLAMRERGIDISGHRARPVTPGMVDSSSLVLVMEDRHRQRIEATGATAPVHLLLRFSEAAGEALRSGDRDLDAPGIRGRLKHLERVAETLDGEGLWALPADEYDVPDPIGLRVDGYEEVAQRIDLPIRTILSALLGDYPPAR